MSYRRLVATAAAACAAVALASAAAGGAGPDATESPSAVRRVVVADGADDVWGIGEATGDAWAVVDMPTADVLGVTVSHRRYQVRVRMRFEDLRRVDPQVYAAWFHHRGYLSTAFVVARRHRWDGRSILTDVQDDVVPCADLGHRIDYAEDRVMMSVPRSCLGRPSWVRVGMRNFMSSIASVDLEEVCDTPFADTAFSRRRTPRLHRPPVS